MSAFNKPRRGQEIGVVRGESPLVFGSDLLTRYLEDIENALNALLLFDTTTTDLNDISSTVNTESKNKIRLDTVLGRYVYPDGPEPADVWYFADGTLANTPV